MVWYSNLLTPDLTPLFYILEPFYQHDYDQVERQIEQAKKSTLQGKINQKTKNYIYSLMSYQSEETATEKNIESLLGQ